MRACCAHNVVERWQCTPVGGLGLFYDKWRCRDCRKEFQPKETMKDRIDLMQEISDHDRGHRRTASEIVRTFPTGATRNLDSDKLKYEGFYSPIVLKRFAEYMHKHRKQPDGTIRPPDNWQKGIPKDAYADSLVRHTMDAWLHHRGFSSEAIEDIESALCAIIFNASGYLFEILQDKHANTRIERSGKTG